MIELLNWFAEGWFRTIVGLFLLAVLIVEIESMVTNICKTIIAGRR